MCKSKTKGIAAQSLIATELPMSEIDSSYRVTADELRQFIERIERLDAEKKDLAEQQKEVMAEAKGRGMTPKSCANSSPCANETKTTSPKKKLF